jgi:hypothetical protein
LAGLLQPPVGEVESQISFLQARPRHDGGELEQRLTDGVEARDGELGFDFGRRRIHLRPA